MSPIHPKVAGAAGFGAFTAFVIAVLTASGVHVDPNLGTTLAVFAAAVGGFLTPALKGEIEGELSRDARFVEREAGKVAPVAEAAVAFVKQEAQAAMPAKDPLPPIAPATQAPPGDYVPNAGLPS